MRIVVVMLFVGLCGCQKAYDYEALFAKRVNEIRSLKYYENSLVVRDDSSWVQLPHWMSADAFYVGDQIYWRKKYYEAVADSKGQNPEKSPNEWRVIGTDYHPYRFLRDSARIEDLRPLLADSSPYVRTYAVATLAHRKTDGLYEIVLENLKDTTQFVQMTGDVGSFVCPADMMLQYTLPEFNTDQKDSIKKLIVTRYQHLMSLSEVLMWHAPDPEHYTVIKGLVERNMVGPFSTIALSRYRRKEDVGLILDRFDEKHYNGHLIFFKAIENFPDEAFKERLIQYGAKIGPYFDYKYYYNALSKYQDRECLRVLEAQVSQAPQKQYDELNASLNPLCLIHQSLKKYYVPMYDPLINKIERILGPGIDCVDKRQLKVSPWDYD